MNSCLYLGEVQHVRHIPRRHLLRYRVAYFFLNLEEIPRLTRELQLFRVNRRGLFSWWENDHLDGRGPTAGRLLHFLDQHGIPTERVTRICLLTHARQWNYVFNPVSFFYCFGSGDQLLLVVAEVNNTFGERYHYILPADSSLHNRDTVLATAPKLMHVSPFTSRDAGRYFFRIRYPSDRLTVAIRLAEGTQPVIDAVVWARRVPLSDRQLLRLALRHPWLTAKVTTAIHWEALRLYLKGIPFFHQPAPSEAQKAQAALWQKL
jgi:DUF1365 family protein